MNGKKNNKGFSISLDMIASVVVTIFISAICMALWLYEILYIIGWAGTEWLKVFHYSPILIAILITFSFLFPLYIKNKDRVEWRNFVKAAILFFLTNWLFYLLGWIIIFISSKIFFYSLFSSFHSYNKLITFIGLTTTWGAFSFLGSLSYKEIGSRIGIISFRRKGFLAFYLMTFSVIPLSVLSLIIFNGYSKLWYLLPADAIKRGYPIFWICMVLGLFSTFYAFYYSPRTRTKNELFNDTYT
jgi:hypothetical protein